MKLLGATLLAALSASLLGGASISFSAPVSVEAAISTPSGTQDTTSLTTSIDLNDSSEEEIRDYYAPLNELGESSLSGNALLASLKDILENMYSHTYDNLWKIYEITDRDWTLSPTSEFADYSGSYGTYNEETNIITDYVYGQSVSKTGGSVAPNNPYVHALYRYNEAGQIREWDNHNASGINREHVWPQSRGFKKPTSGANGPAGTDLHHLKSGDGQVNQNYHNNYPYGNVDTGKTYEDASSYAAYVAGNLLGTSEYDGSSKVFEPCDSDKGDIARAVFYMAARYNNWAGETGVISAYEPFLEITDEAYDQVISVSSSDTTSATMGILHDLLEWHENDPVDEYEIHRNNLIYHNYQGNRNPFIDFPEWVTYIWGTSTDMTSQGSADPSSDTINGYNSSFDLDNEQLIVTLGEDATLTASGTILSPLSWSIDNEEIASITPNGNSVSIHTLKRGGTTIRVTDEQENSASCSLRVITEGEDLHSYRKLSYSDSLANGTYLLGAESSSNSYLLDVPFVLEEDKMLGTKAKSTYIPNDVAPFHFLELEINEGKATIYDGQNYLGAGEETALVLSSSPYEWTLTQGTNGSYRFLSTDNRALLYRGSTDVFGNYAISNVSSGGEYHDLEIYAIFTSTSFFSYFLEATEEIAKDDSNASEEEVLAIWAEINEAYANLSSYDQNLVSTDSSTEGAAYEAMQRYTTLVNKYSALDDYLGKRTASPTSSINPLYLYIGIPVASLLALIIVLLLWKKGGKKKRAKKNRR